MRMEKVREILILENIHMYVVVSQLDLPVDFGVKTNAKMTPMCKLREKSKTGSQSCLYAVTLTPIFS